MKRINIVAGILFLLSACSGNVPTAISTPSATNTNLPALEYSTVTPTQTPTLTPPPSPIPTATWIVKGPGDLTIPILLYHHIDISPTASRYHVSPELFEQELKVLRDWDYSTISTEMLVDAITKGRELPDHPILITFDDGHLDNYTSAFPIMQKYGFIGAIYIVVNYIGKDGYLDRSQILEMHNAGWDVGSHSMNHFDLTKLSLKDERTEIIWSKKKLEEILGIKILTFAYPFGARSNISTGLVREAGYIAAMGAEGYTDNQGKWNLYNLQRVEVKASEDAKSFTRFLTWKGNTDNPLP
jgi:peptidoglycan/xylan/chitin deacetylase (PgdA/CDA1 family)